MRDPRMARRMSSAPRMSVVFTPISLQDCNMADEQEVGKTASIRTFCTNHIKSIVTLILVLGMVFCVVMIVIVHKENYEKEQANYRTGCLDVAIIGSGISGAYAAWSLRNKGLRVHVYEMSDQVGGMFQTLHSAEMPDFFLDMGVTSYSPEQQPQLASLIRVLQLPHHTSRPPNPDPPTFFLRNSLLTMSDLRNSQKVPYRLRKSEKGKSPDELQTYYKRQLIGGYHSINKISQLMLNTTLGLTLYRQGYQNILGQVGSLEGRNFLQDTAKWRHLMANDNAAQLLMEPWETLHYDYVNQKVLKGGMQSLPIKLLQDFTAQSLGAEVKLNHQLECIREKHGVYQLIFIKTERTESGSLEKLRESAEVCSNKVILAVPPKSLQYIEWKPYDEHFIYREALNSVIEYPVMRIFFLYSKLWFETDDVQIEFQDVYTDMPIHHFKYLGNHTSDEKIYHAFLVAEAEGEDLKYFQGLLDLTYFDCERVYKCRDSKYLVNDITRQIATLLQSKHMLQVEDMPDPEQVIINDWTKTTGTGSWYNWKKGVWWEKLEKNMTKPQNREDVYFVGNGFTGGQSQHNVEGIFQSVDQVIDNYFNTSVPE